jgi:peptidoglycan/LPS O-acetylase OafA/YrhL
MRRALRIFPLYYGLIAVFALWFATRTDERAVLFRQDLPFLLLYLTNWFPASGMFTVTWSLAAEEQFYLLWPPIERYARRYALALLLLAMAVSQVIHFGLIDETLERLFGWPPEEPRMLRETTFMPICLGVLLAHALHHRPMFERLARFLAGSWAAPLAFAALLVFPHLCPDDLRGWPRLTVHLLMAVLLCTAVVREDHRLSRFYALRPIARVGALSYGIYLLHHIGIAVAEKGLPRLGWEFPSSHFLIGGAITYVLAELSYRFYETRFLKLKAKYSAH